MTPYFPLEINAQIKMWEETKNMPVLTWAMTLKEGQCRNCGGDGLVYIRFCEAGPYKTPFHPGVMTWFDGDGRYGKGWYRVKNTIAINCPKCGGIK